LGAVPYPTYSIAETGKEAKSVRTFSGDENIMAEISDEGVKHHRHLRLVFRD
jgi:hypothetical protein